MVWIESREQLELLLERTGHQAHGADIARTAAACAALLATPASVDSQHPLGSSKLGGDPDLPADAQWPRGRGKRPLSFVAQLDLAELAACALPAELPRTGLLSFFCDLARSASQRSLDVHVAHHTHQREALVRRPAPADATGVPLPDVLPASPLRVRRALSFPPMPAFSSSEREAVWYLDNLSIRPHSGAHQALGIAGTLQPTRASKQQLLLLQIDSDPVLGLRLGDLGRLFFWISKRDLAAAHFGAVRATLQE